MIDPKRIVISFMLLLAVAFHAVAQSGVPDCDDIKVETKVTQPTNNLSNGTIDLVFSKPVNNYKVFLLNAGSDGTGKEEVHGGKVTNLRSGFFDFLIIDRNRKGCVKQLTVVLK
jgi:hypothetical protein